MIKDVDKYMPKITRIAVDAFANQNNLRSNKLDPLSNPPSKKTILMKYIVRPKLFNF